MDAGRKENANAVPVSWAMAARKIAAKHAGATCSLTGCKCANKIHCEISGRGDLFVDGVFTSEIKEDRALCAKLTRIYCKLFGGPLPACDPPMYIGFPSLSG